MLALISALLLLAAGCAGNSTTCPFQGSFAGTWSEAAQNNRGAESGAWTGVVITSDGLLTGNATNSAADHAGLTGYVTGTVDNSGNVNATCSYPGFAPTVITGKFALTTPSQVTSTLVEAVGATNYNMALILNLN